MNKARRNEIQKQINNLECNKKYFNIEKLNDGSIRDFLESRKSDIEDIYNDEEFAFDNMPEGLQYSMRGETAQECIDLLSDAIDLLDEIIEKITDEITIEELIEQVEEVCSLLEDVICA